MKRIYFNTKLAITITLLAGVSAVLAFSTDRPAESPVELVRRTVQREIAPGNSDARAMFVDRKETPHGSQTKLIVETRDGMAGMLIAINDKPLTPEQRQGEEARLSELAHNPEALKKKQKSEKEDAERITRIMKALPDAFLYEPDGTTVGEPDNRESWRPVGPPQVSPESQIQSAQPRGAGAYRNAGLPADRRRASIASQEIDGTLSKEVGFGWGILGHLDRGGHFLVEQAEVIQGGTGKSPT